MFLPLVLGWIGITVGGLLLLALIDVGRAVVRRVAGLRARRVGKPSLVGTGSLDPEGLGGSPSRAK
jgi:hypothetical protein